MERAGHPAGGDGEEDDEHGELVAIEPAEPAPLLRSDVVCSAEVLTLESHVASPPEEHAHDGQEEDHHR